MDDHIKLGIVRGISYGVFGKPDVFMPQLRALGAGLARVYITWNQGEPDAGHYEWNAVDALLGQIEPDDEIWVTVVSASRWATQPSDFLPASPPTDLARYGRFVAALVDHCAGRVQYWQCNNEFSNPGLWSGSADEYAALATRFADAVRTADPAAQIVLGGCGFDVLSSPKDSPQRAMFGTVLEQARDAFDLFAVHLYDDPSNIPGHIEDVRSMMRANGYEKPVVVGEYGGPTLLGFPALEPVMQQIMMEAFAGQEPAVDSAGLAAQVETPDRKAMRALYARMPSLPPQLQMFMQNCPPELAAKRDRIACREIITRNLLALSCGVTRTICWDLGPEVPNYRDPFNLMGFLSDKLALLDFEDGVLGKRERAAASFRLLADALHDATEVQRIESVAGVVAVAVERGDRGPLQVLWAEGDAFSGEDALARAVSWRWPGNSVQIVDAFGVPQIAELREGRLALALTVTPLLISAD